MKRISRLFKYTIVICIMCTNVFILQKPIDVKASGSRTSSTPIAETVTTSDDGKLSLKSSGLWLNTEKTKAQLNLNLDTTLHMITGRPKQDIVFVVDESGSMKGDRIAKVKESLLDSPKTLLEPGLDNRIALVGFSTKLSGIFLKDNTTTYTDFTNNARTFSDAANRLDSYDKTPYVSGLNRAKSLITRRSDPSRAPVVIFMSDGMPDEDPKTIKAAANELKNLGTEMYVIQYMCGSEVRDYLKVIATKPENAYNAPSKDSVVDMYSKVIGEVKGETRKYKDVTIEIPFDNGNFDIKKISSTMGSIKQEGNILKWTIPEIISRYSTNLAINIELTDKNLEGNLYTYNQGKILYSSQDISKTVKMIDSPTLTRNFYKVKYEGNGNTGGSTPADDKVIGLDAYEIPDNPGFLSKKGEVFNGWQREDTGEVVTRKIVMPEKDITLKAVWGKVQIEMNTSTKGSVNTMNTNALRSKFTNYASITQVEFVNNTNAGGIDLSKNQDGTIVGWLEGTKLYVGSPETIYLPEDASDLFNGFVAATAINFNGLVSSYYTTNMSNMFKDCTKISSLSPGEFDTSKVTNMSGMFWNCKGLTSLGVNSFDTSKVTSMFRMFSSCEKLTTLDVSNFNTSQVTDMTYMFSSCLNLQTLDVNNFDTRQVTDMTYMFSSCGNLETLDVSNFDTSNVKSISWMFGSCDNLKTIDLSNFNTSNVTNMSYLFAVSSSLETLDLSSFDTSKTTYMNSMFNGCEKLSSVNVTSFDTRKVESIGYMFYNCGNLTLLDLSSFDTRNVSSTGSLFQGCIKLTTVYARTQDDANKFRNSTLIPGSVNVVVKTTRSAINEVNNDVLETTTTKEVEAIANEYASKATTTTKKTVDGGRIDLDDIIDYDITVSYTATADVKSKVLSITNRLPDGMRYVEGSDSANPPVRIVSGDGGLASGDVYDIKIENEAVTFKIKNLSAGSKIKLNYQAQAPSSVPDGYQEFLNQASVSVEEVSETSNYVRHYIGLRTKPLHTLTYIYDGTQAADAPDLPSAMEYIEGQKINVVNVGMPGYIFNGWKVDGVNVDSDTFVMPNKNVQMEGSWTKLTETNALKSNVRYEYRGDVPEGVSAPSDVEYTVGSKVDGMEKVNGKTVFIQNNPSAETGYSFGGWKSDDLTSEELNDKEFVLGSQDVVIYGEWKKDSYKVIYEYQGNMPTDVPNLPNEETYSWGENVDLLEPLDPVGNFTFDGWYCDEEIDTDFNETKSFTMPQEDVRLFAMWSANPLEITYKQEGEIPKDVDRVSSDGAHQDAINSVWMAPETTEITNNDGILGEWIFDGWKSKDVRIEADGTYIMPDKEIEFVGKWSFKENENVRRVKFIVENGSWKDGSSEEIILVKVLKDGKTTLDINEVPTGMVGNEGYDQGTWLVEPNTSSGGIRGNVTYYYQFYKNQNHIDGLDTGDTTDLMVMVGVLAIATICIVYALVGKKKKQHEK